MLNGRFIPRTCPSCGDPKNELRDGVEYLLRCNCDWERGFIERVRKTVNPSCWRVDERNRDVKKLTDWDPPIFNQDVDSTFHNLLVVQKAILMRRLNDFCFKILEKNEKTGEKKYALSQSVDLGRNLFIRGPSGSGRGLIVASIKLLAAVKDMSATPNPGEWVTMRNDLIESESFGITGDMAKIRVNENYAVVDLLTIENLRPEGRETDERARRGRGIAALDDLLSRRMARRGSTIVTSSDFVKQIGETVGDKMHEMLTSPKTMLVLLLSKAESRECFNAIKTKENVYNDPKKGVGKLCIDGKSSVQERFATKETTVSFEEALYFEHAFNPDGKGHVTQQMRLGLGDWPKSTQDVWLKFDEEREKNTLDFQDRINKTYMSIAGMCSFATKMSDREKIEVGRLMSYARKIENASDLEKKTKALMQRMISE
jgi:hypothetical protein